jgi:hypothetical protein
VSLAILGCLQKFPAESEAYRPLKKFDMLRRGVLVQATAMKIAITQSKVDLGYLEVKK